jgi:hypothetical protein
LRQQLEVDRTTSVQYVAGQAYYYEVRFEAGTEYKLNFVNYSAATWTIFDAQGNVVADSATDTAYVADASAYYYVMVKAAQDSTGTPENPTTITLKSHIHSLSNKGVCECGYVNSDFIMDLDALAVQGGLKVGQIAAGKYFLRATMTAGKSYMLKFNISVGEITIFKLYGGENADIEKTITDDVFQCEESGVYYYVVEITRSTASNDSIEYSVDGSVAHAHTFTSAYHYVKEEGKYYRVIDKCDEETCNASWSEEISALTVGIALEIDYTARTQYNYALELQAGSVYTVSFENSDTTWKLVKADGTEVANNVGGTYECLEDGAYYLEVFAISNSNDKHGAVATLTVAAQ